MKEAGKSTDRVINTITVIANLKTGVDYTITDIQKREKIALTHYSFDRDVAEKMQCAKVTRPTEPGGKIIYHLKSKPEPSVCNICHWTNQSEDGKGARTRCLIAVVDK